MALNLQNMGFAQNHHITNGGAEPWFLENMNILDKMTPSWKCGQEPFLIPYKLVSLLDILRFQAHSFVVLMSSLQAIEGRLWETINPKKPHPGTNLSPLTLTHNSKLPQTDKDTYVKTFINMAVECKIHELSGSLKLIKNIGGNLHRITIGNMKEDIRLLREMIEAELEERIIIRIPQERVDWYDKEDGFSIKVSKAFKKAIPDIKEAGNCYAIGLYTACVFHLSRVAEYGLRALARERSVSIKNKPLEYAEWGPIIREIEKTIDPIEAKAHAGPEKDAALAFYQGSLGEFRGFKSVYRNPVMHPRKIYDKHEAGSAMQHISGFMKRLSEYITEKSQKSINWKLKYGP